MKKFLAAASVVALMGAAPALAQSGGVQKDTTGADPNRTGSAATQGSATGGGMKDVPASSGMTKPGGNVQTGTTGADAARTGSAATQGSATGGGMQQAPTASSGAGSAGPVQTPTTGADPNRTGSAATPGSATGGGAKNVPGGDKEKSAAGKDKRSSADPATLHGLIGRDVENMAGKEIGEVEDVVLVDGRPMLVVEVGGFLGIGAKTVTVPYEEATMTSDSIRVNMSEDQLKQQPAYKADELKGTSIKSTYKK